MSRNLEDLIVNLLDFPGIDQQPILFIQQFCCARKKKF